MCSPFYFIKQEDSVFMQYIFFDTETTSLERKTEFKNGGEVVQFSAIICDESFEIVRVINRYASTTQVFDPRASAVNKLNDQIVSRLSEGKFLEYVIQEEKIRELDDVIWIGYNSNSFDIPMINQTLTQNGFPGIQFGPTTNWLSPNIEGVYKFDAIHKLGSIISGRRDKLSNLINKDIGNDTFIQVCKDFKEYFDIVEPTAGEDSFLHNAVYDSLAVWLLVRKYKAHLFG